MALPKQQLAVYTAVIPSNKRKIKFRGFTVREEKTLLLAQESEDADVILNCVKTILESCIQEKVDIEGLTMFDIEYLMTHIRSKSVGETIQLRMPCDNDASHERTLVGVDVSKIEVKFPEGHETLIPLYDDVSVQMKYPSLRDIVALEQASGLDAVAMCIDKVITHEEVYETRDETREEMMDFIESLTKEQLQRIEDKFFMKMPVFEHDLVYKCRTCGHQHVKTIRGLSNFFV